MMVDNEPSFALTTSEHFPAPLNGKVHADSHAAAISIEDGWARDWEAMPTSLRETVLDEIRSGAVDGRMLRWLLDGIVRGCILARRGGPEEKLPFVTWLVTDIVGAMEYAGKYEDAYDAFTLNEVRPLAAAAARLDAPESFEFFRPVFDPTVDTLAWVRRHEELQPASL